MNDDLEVSVTAETENEIPEISLEDSIRESLRDITEKNELESLPAEDKSQSLFEGVPTFCNI